QREGISNVICEEKHMGSRAIVVICRDSDVARKRFGVDSDCAGVCYTRTGRPFFTDPGMESGLVGCARAALTESDFWREFETGWVCLDAELMPWSAKAQDLIRKQYA